MLIASRRWLYRAVTVGAPGSRCTSASPSRQQTFNLSITSTAATPAASTAAAATTSPDFPTPAPTAAQLQHERASAASRSPRTTEWRLLPSSPAASSPRSDYLTSVTTSSRAPGWQEAVRRRRNLQHRRRRAGSTRRSAQRLQRPATASPATAGAGRSFLRTR